MKTAVIVGASSGLGREMARILIGEGWRVGVAARRLALLQELVSLCPERVVAEEIDVCSADAPARLLSLFERVGGADLYFHASGIGKQNPALDESIEISTVETNATGFVRMVGTAFRYFAARGGGQIAAITSIAGTKGLGTAPSYSATKAMQATYMQALSQLAAMRGLPIHMTDIRPGFVATELLGDNPRYPMLMRTEPVARMMAKAVLAHRRVVVLDWRWRVVTSLWHLIPNWLWRRMRVGVAKDN